MALARSLVLARLVGPNAFGLFAAVVAFTSLITLAADFGLSAYILHKGRAARPEAPAVAIFSLATGVSGALVVLVLAIPIGAFYRLTSATEVALALAFGIVLTCLQAAPSGLLRSELRFFELGMSQLIAEATATACALAVAFVKGGVWALVAASLTAPLVALVIQWARARVGVPRLGPGWRTCAAAAFRYGGPIVGGSALWAMVFQVDNVVVGRVLGTTALGRYAFAYSYGTIVGAIVAAIITQVAFASLVIARDDEHLLGERFEFFGRQSSLVVMPLAAIGIGTAPAAVQWVLGQAWEPAILPLQLFLVVGAVRAALPADAVIRALAKTRWELITGAVAAPATFAAAVIGARAGLPLVSALVSAVAVASTLWIWWLTARFLAMPVVHLARIPLRAALVSAVSGLAGGLALLLPLNRGVVTVIGVALGATVYGLGLLFGAVPGSREMAAVLGIPTAAQV